MTGPEENIKRVNIKLQQLLKQYRALQKENERLSKTLKETQDKKVSDQQTIEMLNQQVLILKSAALQLSDADKKEFEKRINQYIKEVDKCINFLSD
ncbi:MAG: hypothetical protein ABJA78_14310 [Ferruginibacter sp.]